MSTPLSQFALAVANLVNPSNGGYTAYTYETDTNNLNPNNQPIATLTGTTTPTIYTDCSGWVNYALNTVAPIHQAVESATRLIPYFNPAPVSPSNPMDESSWPWARADVLSYFFGEMANGSNGFVSVDNFATLQAGDLIAYATGIYTNPTHSSTAPPLSSGSVLAQTQDSGHTMIVVGTPVAVPQPEWAGSPGLLSTATQVFAVPVVDSSSLPHFQNIPGFNQPLADSRDPTGNPLAYPAVIANPPNLPLGFQTSSLTAGGLGTGTLWFSTDSSGTPLQFRFSYGDPWFANTLPNQQNGDAAVRISAGRLTSTIDLSGSMLDANNNLVVTAFADAAPVLNGTAYNTQSETLTGSGGLYVQGEGTIQLGAGNSFTGGVSIANATVSLAGAGAAGGGIVTFVSDFNSTLDLQSAAAVPAATLLDFSAGDAIDLSFHNFVAGDHALWTQASGAGGTLAILSAGGTPIAKLSLNGLYATSQFNVSSDSDGSTHVATTVTSPITAHDDAYVVVQGQALAIAAATGVTTNDEGVTSVSLVGNVAHGTLQLAANGGFNYTPIAGFTGVDSFSYDAGNDGSADAQVQIYVAPVQTAGGATTLNLLALNVQQLIAANYDAFFGRGPDAAGFTFWINQFNAGQGSQSLTTLLGNIASSFAVSSEAQALYPFLANPQNATPAQINTFINSVYDNLFDRLPDAAGLTYWTASIQQTLASGGFVGSVLVSIMAGAQNSSAGQDITTLTGKIAVGLEYVQEQQLFGSPWSAANDAANATALLQAVNAAPQSVLVGIAQAQNLVLGDLS